MPQPGAAAADAHLHMNICNRLRFEQLNCCDIELHRDPRLETVILEPTCVLGLASLTVSS
jgi:hypothetical protein